MFIGRCFFWSWSAAAKSVLNLGGVQPAGVLESGSLTVAASNDVVINRSQEDLPLEQAISFLNKWITSSAHFTSLARPIPCRYSQWNRYPLVAASLRHLHRRRNHLDVKTDPIDAKVIAYLARIH